MSLGAIDRLLGLTRLSRVEQPFKPTKPKVVNVDKLLAEFVGQQRAKRLAAIHVRYAIRHNLPLPHTVLFGSAGLGKTTFAKLLARATKAPYRYMIGSEIGSARAAREAVQRIIEREVFFIDEIHRLTIRAEEVFYPVMEEFSLGELSIPPFSLFGATTIPGMLTKPMFTRFGLHIDLDPYTIEELAEIIKRSKEGKSLSLQVRLSIAERSLGIPRVGIKIADTVSKADNLEEVLELLKIDKLGLTERHLSILRYLRDADRPVGIQALSFALDIRLEDLESLYEPDLVRLGFIERTTKGRMITKKGLQHVGP